jgi:hypothetical protein
MNAPGMKKTLDVTGVRIVALYEPDSGKILHVHTVTMFQGGREVTVSEAIEAALEHASRIGHMVERLQTKVSSNHEHSRRPHRIDLQTGEFVPHHPPEFKIRAEPKLAS